MKLPKSLLALLLALVLVFTLALPAFAEDEPEEPNPAMPVIIVQPGDLRISELTKDIHTSGFMAQIPNGDEMVFQLYRGETLIRTGRPCGVTGTDATGDYHIVVTNRDQPEYCVASQTFHVEVYVPSFFERIQERFYTIWDGIPKGLKEIPETILTILLYPVALPLAALFELFLLLSVTVGPMLMLLPMWIASLFS